MGVVNFILPPYLVANQLKILIPVDTAIIVAAVKYARVSTSIPTVNLWAQTMNPRMAIANWAYAIPK